MPSSRIDWIDSWRGLLIVLVVSGHALGGASHIAEGANGTTLEHMCDFIYIFHMPAFFCLAGLLWKDPQSIMSFIRKKALRLIVPYFIFGVVSSVVYMITIGNIQSSLGVITSDNYYGNNQIGWGGLAYALIHAGGAPNAFNFRMNSVLWFLPCMFMVEVIYAFITRWIKAKNADIFLLVGLWLFSFLIAELPTDSLPWGLMKVPTYLGFLIIGRVFSAFIGNCERSNKLLLSLGCLSVLLLSWFYLVFPNPWVARMNIGWFVAFKLAACAGIVTTLVLSMFLNSGLMRLIGVASMAIMLVHKFPIVFLETKVAPIVTQLKSGLLCAYIATIGVTLVATILSIIFYFMVKYVAPWSIGLRRSE